MIKSIFFTVLISLVAFQAKSQSFFSQDFAYSMNVCQLLSKAPDEGYYFCGRSSGFDLIIGKIDSSGNLKWAKQIGAITGELPRSMAVLSNGNVVVAFTSDSGAFSNSQSSFVTSFDTSGNYLFTKKVVCAAPGVIISIINIIKDGNGFSISVSLSSVGTRIIKLDSLGNKITAIGINNQKASLFKRSSGDYLLYSMYSGAFSRFDSQLNYQNTTGIVISSSSIYGLIELSNGYLMYYGGTSPTTTFVCKLSPQLQYIWSKRYYKKPFNSLNKIAYGQQTDTNSVWFFAGGESNKPQYVLNIDFAGNVLHCKELLQNGSLVETMIANALFEPNNFAFTKIVSNGNFGQSNVFNISKVDSGFSQICQINDLQDTIIDGTLDYYGSVNFTANVIADSLINDSLPVSNIVFYQADCSLNLQTDELNDNNEIKIFPNPASDIINLKLSFHPINNPIIIVRNYTGEIVEVKEYDSEENYIQINIENFPSGIYLIEFNLGNKFMTKKFVKCE